MRLRTHSKWLVSSALFVAAALPVTSRAVSAAPAAPTPRCIVSPAHCVIVALTLINRTRAQYGVPPLRLNTQQSGGDGHCPGALGHSLAMAVSGGIWDKNAGFPGTSFPANMCIRYRKAGENVGMAASGHVHRDLRIMHTMMMAEPHDASSCRSSVNHACNILDPAFHQIGIGIAYSHGATWLTENFIN